MRIKTAKRCHDSYWGLFLYLFSFLFSCRLSSSSCCSEVPLLLWNTTTSTTKQLKCRIYIHRTNRGNHLYIWVLGQILLEWFRSNLLRFVSASYVREMSNVRTDTYWWLFSGRILLNAHFTPQTHFTSQLPPQQKKNKKTYKGVCCHCSKIM